MAGRPRKPKESAIAEGRDVINAGRYADRTEAGSDLPGLGEPPEWMQDTEECLAESAWRIFQTEAPWLKQSHRMIVAMASQLQGAMMAGTGLDVKEMTLFRGILSSLGMTPADAGKVILPEKPKEPEKGDILAARKRR